MLQMMYRLTWNSRGWRMPTANSADGGYPSETGFGHEEWNFQIEDAIDGFVYGYLYYSKPSADILKRSNGLFNIGFWSMHPDTHGRLLVGAYKQASLVSNDEMSKIHSIFKKKGIIDRRAEELVSVLPSMSLEKAIKEINDSFSQPYIKWKCPVDSVEVYEPMMPLPANINGKPIGAYFTRPTFVDFSTILNQTISGNKSKIKIENADNTIRTSPLAEDAYYRESARNLRTIIPRHNKLSNEFCAWLKSINAGKITQEKSQVDVSFTYNGKSYLSELKICYGVGTTKALREALGQLFEYNYYSTRTPKDIWLIVLDNAPSNKDIEYIKRIVKIHSLPINIGWPDGNSFKFMQKW